jgi:hypothetical protein
MPWLNVLFGSRNRRNLILTDRLSGRRSRWELTALVIDLRGPEPKLRTDPVEVISIERKRKT